MGYRWLFIRFVLRRLRLNPLRPLLLVAALTAASSLWGAVLRTTAAGVQSFEESLGYSRDAFPVIVTPVGGRIAVAELQQCLAPLASSHDIVALRREAGWFETERGRESVTLVGIAGSGAQVTLFGDVGSHSVVAPEGYPAGEARITVGDASIAVHVLGRSAARAADPAARGVEQILFQGSGATNKDGNGRPPQHTILTSLAVLNQVVGGSMVDTILMRPQSGVFEESSISELSTWLSSCWSGGVPLRVESIHERVSRGEALLGAYRLNVTVLAAMTLLVCALVISHATQLSLLRVARELSIVRTLGVPRWWCAGAVMGEALVIGVIGALVGCTVGQSLTLRIAGYLLETAEEIYAVSLRSVGGGAAWRESLGIFVAMVFVSLAGAGVACRSALRVLPSVGTRREHVQVRELSPRAAYRLGWAAFLVIVGVTVLLVWYPKLVWGYGAVGAGILWCLGSVPALFALLPRVLPRGGKGVSWRCARGGVVTFARGHLVGAMSAAVAIALMSAIGLMVDSFRSTLEGWTAARLRGDLYISSQVSGKGNEALLSDEVIRTIRAVPEVDQVLPYREVTTEWHGVPLVVGGTDIVTHARRGAYLFVGEPVTPEVLAQPVNGRSPVLISESAARKLGLTVEGAVEIAGRSFHIAAIVQEFSTEHPLIVLPERDFTEIFRNHDAQTLTVYLTPGSDRGRVKERVRSLPGYALQVRDERELAGLIMTLFERTFRVTTSSRWIVFGVALLGIVIAVWQLAWERRRELKVMHTLGMSRTQITHAVTFESCIVSCVPLVVGIVGGVYIGWVLTCYVNLLSFGWGLRFSVSWAPVVTALEFVGVLSLVVWCCMFCGVPWLVRRATVTDE